jgi:AcrR family transcriptional regulator
MSTPRTDRRRPQQARSRKKVERIVAAARRVLAREGAAALNTNRIAAEAGVGVGSVYDYFPNKQAIAVQLIEELAAEEAAAVMTRIADAGDDLRAIITATIETTVQLYRQNQATYRGLWGLTDLRRTIGHRPGERMILEQAAGVLEAHQDELATRDVALTAFTAFHLIESLAYRFVTEGEGRWSDARCAEEIRRVVFAYLFAEAP